MPDLGDFLTGDRRSEVLDAATRLIDDEVARKKGLRAMALKAGYKVVKGVKPGFVRSAVDHFLPEFCEALNPYYQEWAAQAEGARGSFGSTLQGKSRQVANALLGVTDRRAERAKNKLVKKTYHKLRSTAEAHVAEALPGVGRTLQPFLS